MNVSIPLLEPKSIAVIGASRNPEKLGYAIIKNIVDYGYQGRLYPVNPKAEKILHLRCYADISQIEDSIELAIIVVPAVIVAQVLRSCGEKNVKYAVIISAGFKETGSNGEKLEKELKKISVEYGIRIIGPNTLGFINTLQNLNATFGRNEPIKGNIAFLSQSGALATAFLDLAQKAHLGFSYFVSLGNKVDIDELDLLRQWKHDQKLKSIFCYLEDIRHGKEFLKEIKEISLHKPVVILKPGESAEAQKAISSHTGSMSGNFQATVTGFSQNGVIQANSIEEFFNLMIVFNNFPVSYGSRVGIITNAGGPAVIITEHIIKAGLQLAQLSSKTTKQLKELMPSTVNIRNPMDVVGDALSDRYATALQALIDDPHVDTIAVLLTPQFMTEIKKTAKVIVDFTKMKKKLILTSFLGGTHVEEGIRYLREHKVAHYSYPNQLVTVIQKLIKYQIWMKTQTKTLKLPSQDPKISVHHKIQAKEFIGTKNGYLTDKNSFELLRRYNFPVVPYVVVNSVSSTRSASYGLGFPLVMKISSPFLIHKTENSGVIVNIKSVQEAEQSYESLMKLAKKKVRQDLVNGIVIQKMISPSIELIMGIVRDPNFGHMVMVGSGGIYTEIYRDIAFRLLPTDVFSLESMLEETKIYRILQGARNKKYPYQKLLDLLLKLQQLICDFPEIKEIDLNPLLITQEDIFVVDAKINIDTQ